MDYKRSVGPFGSNRRIGRELVLVVGLATAIGIGRQVHGHE